MQELPEHIRARAWTLMGMLFLAGGGFSLLSLATGHWPGVRHLAVLVAIAVAATVLGGVALLLRDWLSCDLRLLVAGNLLGAGLITASVWAAGLHAGPMYGALYGYAFAFAFFYYSRGLALIVVALCAMMYLTVVAVMGLPGGVGQVAGVLGIATVPSCLMALVAKELRSTVSLEREVAQRLRELDAMRSGFMQAVSHEIRTPLSIVYGNAQTLERIGHELPVSVTRTMVSQLARQAERLERLTTDILDVDRLTRSGRALRPELVDLSLLVASACREHRGTTIDLEIDLDPVVVEVDTDKVRRVLEQLLDNAERHTPAGTHVRVRADVAEQRVRFIIEDAGPGIPDGVLPEMFLPLHQGLETATMASPGTGIGLALVSSLAEVMGGRVRGERSALGGLRVVVELPLRDRRAAPHIA